MFIEHGKNEAGALRGEMARVVEQRVGGKALKLALEHARDAHGAAREQHARGGVVRRADDRDIGCARGGADFLVDGQAAGDDDGVDARGDRHFLNVRAVADEKDDVLFPIMLEPRREGFPRHRADHEQLLRGFRRERAGDERAAEGGNDVGDRGGDFARRAGLLARWKKMVADFECAQQAEAAIAFIDDRQAAQPLLVDELQRIVNRRVRAHGNDARLHDIGDARREVVDERGRLDAEFFEDEIDALIRVAGARGEDVRVAGEALELCVADGRADGIHVGIFVADDDRLHARRRMYAARGRGKDARVKSRRRMRGETRPIGLE